MLTLMINTEFHIFLTDADDDKESIYTRVTVGLLAEGEVSGSLTEMGRGV